MRLDGIVHRHEITARGIDRTAVRAGLRSGEISRLGPWYMRAGADQRLFPYLEAGLRPTCVDAAVLHGLWTPPVRGAHAFLPRGAGRRGEHPATQLRLVPVRGAATVPPSPPQPVMLHRPVLRSWPSHDPVPDLELVLEHAARCLSPRDTAIVMESALNRGAITRTHLKELIAGLPRYLRRPLSRLQSTAESGTETAVRWWFEKRNVPVRAQVVIAGVGRVDLLVGDRWVIECDSKAHHTGREQYQTDRRRDLALRARGYLVTRLTWEQVFLHWDEVEPQLLAVLARGEHRGSLVR